MGIVKNTEQLVGNGMSPSTVEARQIALNLIQEAVRIVDPRNLVRNSITLRGRFLKITDQVFDLSLYDRLIVVGAGKASGAMAEALEEKLGKRIDCGLVNVPLGTAGILRTRFIELQEAEHPIPGKGGLAGATGITKILQKLNERSLVVVLISGGGSALLPLPQEGITLAEKKVATDLLLRSGAAIEEMNTVRKHISSIKGGQLAALAYPATVVSLILSDIVGDPLASIASGPTVPDPTTYKAAIEILKFHNVWDEIPQSVRNCLQEGLEGARPETPKPGDIRFGKVHNIVIGNNRIALNGAAKKAKSMGLKTLILSSFVEGEARHVGTTLAGLAREMKCSGTDLSKYNVVIAGGETTVTIAGHGRGGRNQELALSASLKIDGVDGVVLASIGSDGIDGLSNNAGAIVDGYTVKRSAEEKMNPLLYLANNDSDRFFSSLHDGIVTGLTGTNVNDIMLLVNVAISE